MAQKSILEDLMKNAIVTILPSGSLIYLLPSADLLLKTINS